MSKLSIFILGVFITIIIILIIYFVVKVLKMSKIQKISNWSKLFNPKIGELEIKNWQKSGELNK